MNAIVTHKGELARLVEISKRRKLTTEELERYYLLHGVDAQTARAFALAGGRDLDVRDERPVS